MPDITITAETLYRMAVTKMKEIEERMADLETELSNLRLEHGKLYAMAMVYRDDSGRAPDAPEGMDF